MSLTKEQYDELCMFRNVHWDNCTKCEKHFAFGDNETIGYLMDGSKSVVCEDCSKYIVGDNYHAVYLPKDYDIPPENAILWRYIDFTKFVSLLESKSLFFTRSDKFEDPFEGARGYASQEKKAYEGHRKIISLEVRSEHCGDKDYDEKKIEEEVDRRIIQAKKKFQLNREHFFISCWHENDSESEAMWKLYTSPSKQGVAIQTTVGKLIKSIDNCFMPQIGRVKYISYAEPLKPNSVPFWYKRDSFSYEKEIRLILEVMDKYDYGIPVPINLDTMIENIYVSPLADKWFFELVKNVVLKYGINKKINFSHLNKEPLF